MSVRVSIPDENEQISWSHYTHSLLKTHLTNVIWIYGTFENNFGINFKLKKYLKESCKLVMDQHFSFKYFLKIVLV